eukprot:scaffold249_cov262-Chaetoceros_neogracile.AAC.14
MTAVSWRSDGFAPRCNRAFRTKNGHHDVIHTSHCATLFPRHRAPYTPVLYTSAVHTITLDIIVTSYCCAAITAVQATKAIVELTHYRTSET